MWLLKTTKKYSVSQNDIKLICDLCCMMEQLLVKLWPH